MNCKPIAIAMASAALVLMSLQPTVGFAKDCEVKPFDAYSTAIKRGWKFSCRNPDYHGSVVSTLLLPEPNGPLLCQWRTGLVPTPPSGTRASMWFFSASGDGTQLKNGWRIKWYEITGGQWEKIQVHPGNSSRIIAYMNLDRRNHTFNYRLTKLVLTKPNGNCANAIHEAF